MILDIKKLSKQTKKQMNCEHFSWNGLAVFPVVKGKIWKCSHCGILKIEGYVPYFGNTDILKKYVSMKNKRLEKIDERVSEDIRKIIEFQIERFELARSLNDRQG